MPIRLADQTQAVQAVRPIAMRGDRAQGSGAQDAAKLAAQRQQSGTVPAERRDTADEGSRQSRFSLLAAPAVGSERRLPSSGMGTTLFLAQIIGQSLAARPATSDQLPGTALQGNEAYRRAGGAPPLFSEDSEVFSRLV